MYILNSIIWHQTLVNDNGKVVNNKRNQRGIKQPWRYREMCSLVDPYKCTMNVTSGPSKIAEMLGHLGMNPLTDLGHQSLIDSKGIAHHT